MNDNVSMTTRLLSRAPRMRDRSRWWARSVVVLAAVWIIACGAAATKPIGRMDVSLADAQLSAAVRTVVLNDRELGLRPISIESRGGVVTLSGSVKSDDEAERAIKLARSVDGVRDVKSTLRAEP